MTRAIVVSLFMIICCHVVYSQQAADAADNQEEVIVNFADLQQAEDLNNQGYMQLAAEQHQEAEQLFQQALSLDSTNLLYYENLARSLAAQQKTEGVAAVYARAQRQFPEASDLYYYRGDALQQLKRYAAAREDYSKAIALSKQNPDTQLRHLYYFNRGNTYLKEKNYAAARQDYDQALSINEFHHGSYANRGFARYKLKDTSGACSDWQKAQEMGYEAAQQYLTKYCR